MTATNSPKCGGWSVTSANNSPQPTRRSSSSVANATRRELERERHRWGWIESRNTELTIGRDRLETERDALAIELVEIRERLARLQRASAAPVVEARPVAAPPTLSRAQRRQLERDRQRRRRT